jgi:hypothetical protein
MEYNNIVGIFALVVTSWLIGRLKPFHSVQTRFKCEGVQDVIERWYVNRDIEWICIKDNIEPHGGPFGLPARLLTFQNRYESVCFSDTESVFNKIKIGTKVRLRLRVEGEGKLGRIGCMLDTYLIPVIVD